MRATSDYIYFLRSALLDYVRAGPGDIAADLFLELSTGGRMQSRK